MCSSFKTGLLFAVILSIFVQCSLSIPCFKVIEKIENGEILLKRTNSFDFVDKSSENSFEKDIIASNKAVECVNVTLTDRQIICQFKELHSLTKKDILYISYNEIQICAPYNGTFKDSPYFKNKSHRSIRKREINSETCGNSEYNPNIQSLVAGGSDFKPGVWPWMAALYCHLKFYCGGTILSEKTILTAAHCVQDKFDPKPRQASHCSTVVGKHYLNSEHEENYFVSSIKKFEIHSSWNPERNNYDGDIAIAVLVTSITYQHNISPICLPTIGNYNDLVGKSGVIAGWGYNDKKKLTTGTPRIVELPIISEQECLKVEPVFDAIMSYRTFCSAPNINKGPCKGDSGSGLCFKENGVWVVRGIVSVSPSSICDGNSSVVYTDVAQYTNWIYDIIYKYNIRTTTSTTTSTTTIPPPIVEVQENLDNNVPDITRAQVDKFFQNIGNKIKDRIQRI